MCIFHIINKLNREGDLLLREPHFYKTNHAIKQLISDLSHLFMIKNKLS